MLYVSKVKLPGQGRCSGSGHCCNSVHPEGMKAVSMFSAFPAREEGAAPGRLLPGLPGLLDLLLLPSSASFILVCLPCLKAVFNI